MSDQTKTEPKTISVPNSALLEATNVLKRVRIATGSEMRANLRLYRELRLEAIEEFVDANAVTGSFEDAAAYAKALKDLQDKLEQEFPAKTLVEISVSKSVADTFRSYLDQFAQMFPEGRTDTGEKVSAGLPRQSARRLMPLLEAVDAAWPTE